MTGALLSNLPQFHLLMSPFLPYQQAFPPSSFAYTTLPLLFQSNHYVHIFHILFSHHSYLPQRINRRRV